MEFETDTKPYTQWLH